MYPNIQILLDKMTFPIIRMHLPLGTQSIIRTAKLFPENREVLENDILYIAKTSDIPKILVLNPNANILCLEDGKKGFNDFDNIQANIIIIGGGADKIEVLTSILDMIIFHQKISTTSIKLLNALIERKGLQYIMEIGYEIFGNPVHVIDPSFKLLAYTQSHENYVWPEIMPEFPSVNLILKERARGTLDKVRQSRRPIIIYTEDKKHATLISTILTDHQIIGYFTVVDINKPFVESDMEIAELFRNVISLEICNNKSIYNTKNSMYMYEYFIADLLNGNIYDSKSIEEKKKLFNLKLKEKIYVLTIRANQIVSDITSLIDIRKQLKELIEGGKFLIYNDDLVVIFSCDRGVSLTDLNINSIAECLEKYCMCGGISRPFYSLSVIREYYQQTLKAIEFGLKIDPKKNLFNYDDYAIFHFLSINTEPKILKSFCHPSLLALKDYDRKNNTDYLHCLYVYYLNDKNLVQASNELHIHRNTLSYRIKKIEEVMDIDIHNENISFYLLLSFKILDFIEFRLE